ncbi:hypothetical protein ACFXHA_10275 [Nocardia sp. NPDC059240]|uniref:baeRF11 domain-containing protein n=1 Tax=Nocardia sp. NPDC059240 TaxID=3346786 RepID=UPI0036840E2B
MLHTDIPTHREIEDLASAGDPWSVSIYTPTEIGTPTPEQHRIAFSNQVREALDHVDDRHARDALAQELDDLIDDEDFWRFQSRTLVVHATPDRVRTYRIPNRLGADVAVGDRFFLKPLLRAVTFPQAAFVLALAEGSVRLIEVSADRPATQVWVPGMPTSAADYVRKASLSGRAPKRRIQGTEGRKLRVRQYARAIDQQLREPLSSRDVPLILAAAEPVATLFRSVNSHHVLLPETIPGNPEHLTVADLADRARQVLDRHYAAELTDLRTLFDKRREEGRAGTDLAEIARAATFGTVDTLLVDIDTTIHGTLDPDDGSITFATDSDITAPGVVDEIARRVLSTGGTVLAVRADDLPDAAPAAAIFRYSL